MKEHVHEIEVKYVIHEEKVDDIFDVLLSQGFVHKATYDLVDRWLPPKEAKESLRVREQTQGNTTKYFFSSKKTNEKLGRIKNKCEAESEIDEFIKDALIGIALRVRSPLPEVRKRRYSWQGRLGSRDYTVVIDEVFDLGRFSGFYFECETLVPFEVSDPKAKDAVERLALRILRAAYKAEKRLKYKYANLSYRKMAKIHQAEQEIA